MKLNFMSRRQLFTATAGASLLLKPAARVFAQAAGVPPKPIPGGVTNAGVFIHHFPPVLGNEPSQITDFDGQVANCRITGTGTGVDAAGRSSPLTFQVDMGFMKGVYIGTDEQPHLGSFGFI